MDVVQTTPVANVVAQDYVIRLQEGVGIGRACVVELEAVGAVIQADVVVEGLVFVAEVGKIGDGVADGGGAGAEFAVDILSNESFAMIERKRG